MHFKEVLSQNISPIIRFMLFCPKTPCFTLSLLAGDAVWSNRQQCVHVGLPVPFHGRSSIRRRSGKRHTAPQVTTAGTPKSSQRSSKTPASRLAAKGTHQSTNSSHRKQFANAFLLKICVYRL